MGEELRLPPPPGSNVDENLISGVSREPFLQRRRRLGRPGGLTQSCRTLLAPEDPGVDQPPRGAPPAGRICLGSVISIL